MIMTLTTMMLTMMMNAVMLAIMMNTMLVGMVDDDDKGPFFLNLLHKIEIVFALVSSNVFFHSWIIVSQKRDLAFPDMCGLYWYQVKMMMMTRW